MPLASNTKARRSHRKSRNGCKECKRRHTKCDENRPSCINCTITSSRCSYLDVHPPRRWADAPLGHLPLQVASHCSASTASLITAPASHAAVTGIIGESQDCNSYAQEANTHESLRFSLSHFMLFYHLENEMLKASNGILVADEYGAKVFSEMVFKSANSAPYLMDEMLAFSALHLSTLQSNHTDKAQYLRQSAELQTRALSLFNVLKPRVHDENCVAMFIFSSIIGMHALFDGVASRNDFADFLNGIIRYFKLHRGVRAIARQSWHILRKTELKRIFDPIESGGERELAATDGDDECDMLMSLLETSRDQLGSEPYRVCYEAVQTLRWVFGQHRILPKPYPIHITLAWPVVISAEFIDLLEQRQPISLAILAYWGMLLHADREFWVFGNAGRVLINFMSSYLGFYWGEWLALPRQVLDSR